MGIDKFKAATIEIANITQFTIGQQFAMQGERNGRALAVQVTNNGVVEPQYELNLNLGWKHQIAKNDKGELLQGLDAFTPIDRETGLFRIDYTSAMMTPGKVDAVIEFVTGNSVTRSKPFSIVVNETPFDEGAAESDNSFSALQAALTTATELGGKLNTVESIKVDKNGSGQIKPGNLSKEVLELIDGSVAEIEVNTDLLVDNAVSNPKVANSAINPVKTTFLKTDYTNYLENPSQIEYGVYYAHNNGRKFTRADLCSVYCKLPPDTLVKKRWVVSGVEVGSGFAVSFWDSEGNFVEGGSADANFKTPGGDLTARVTASIDMLPKAFITEAGNPETSSFSDDVRIDEKNINDKALSRKKADWYEDGRYANLVTSDSFELGGYYNLSGVYTPSDQYSTTKKLYLSPDETYDFHDFSNNRPEDSMHITYWNDTDGEDKFIAGNMIKPFQLYAGANCVRIAIYNPRIPIAVLYNVNRPTEYVDKMLAVQDYNLGTSAVQKIKEIAGSNKSILNNKKWAVLGDSLSSDGDYPIKTWIRILAEKHNGEVTDYGISGTTIAHSDRHLWDYNFKKLDATEIGYDPNDSSTWGTGNCMCERVNKLNDEADYIFFFGGTNDSGAQKGKWNSNDTTNFYGGVEAAFRLLREKYGSKPLICILPPQFRYAQNQHVEYASEALKNTAETSTLGIQLRAEVIRNVAKKWSVPIVDLWNDSSISGTIADLYLDNLHLTQKGQNIIASLVEKKLLSLLIDA